MMHTQGWLFVEEFPQCWLFWDAVAVVAIMDYWVPAGSRRAMQAMLSAATAHA